MTGLPLCGRGCAAGIFALALCACTLQQDLDPEAPRPEGELAHFRGANICQLSGLDTSATARMGLDRWFRQVAYATTPGRHAVVFCRVVTDPDSDPRLGRDLQLNLCRADFDAQPGGEYRVAAVEIRNEGAHCKAGYTLEDAAGRAVLGCTVEYGARCPRFGFGWATMPAIGESTWKSGD